MKTRSPRLMRLGHYTLMGPTIDEVLQRERSLREERRLQRSLRMIEAVDGPEVVANGDRLINFSSNDYLGLSQHPRVKTAAIEALNKYGAGSGASRLISGTLPVHSCLEATIASFKGVPAALSFATGYAAAVGTIPALVGPHDVVIVDKLVHASLVEASRLSGAKLRVFRHNHTEDLRSILEWTATMRAEEPQMRILIVTESVYSMDGDIAPLREIVELKERYGAWLMVDEAHALGVLGQTRRGLAEQLGVADKIEIQMGTLGKAAGASGGFIAGSRILIDHLINSARSFIFSTAPVPAAVAAAKAGLEIIDSDEGEQLRGKLLENTRLFGEAISERFLSAAPAKNETPIVPIILGGEDRTLAAAETLRKAGFLIPAIRYPTVARGQARLRVTLNAQHSQSQIENLLSALKKL
jgi:8-amino-7-oxononanoate synthase